MYGQLYRGFESHPLRQTLICTESLNLPVGEKGPDARRRPKVAGEAYSLYVERAADGANEADGSLSAAGAGWPC